MEVEKEQKKENLIFLYGEDRVTIALRKEEWLKKYFRGNPPEAVIFDGTGNFREYESALSGQSLFTAETAVIIRNPAFLKYPLKSRESLAEQDLFLDFLRNLGKETLLILVWEGKSDSRYKIFKTLIKLFTCEECTLLKPAKAAEVMIHMLSREGMKVDYSGRAYLEEVLSAWEEVSVPFLQTECDKIALMCGPKKLVGKKLLQFALPSYINQGIFAFTDALLDKDASYIMENTDRVFTDVGTVLKNMGFLAAKFRKIKMLKEMKRNHLPVLRMRSVLGVTPGAWQKLQKDAEKVTEAEAEQLLSALFRYQLELRSGISRMEIKDLLLQYCRK